MDCLSATPIGRGVVGNFSTLRDSNPSPRPTANTLTTKPWFVYICRKKWYVTCKFPAIAFLRAEISSRIVPLWLLRTIVKAISEFLSANLSEFRILECKSMHLIAFDIDWSWNIFTSHNFCSLLIDLEKVRTKNLKFRTDLQDRVMGTWSVTQ